MNFNILYDKTKLKIYLRTFSKKMKFVFITFFNKCYNYQ